MSGEERRFGAAASRGRTFPIAVLAVVLVASAGAPALGCDLCAIYTATEIQESRTGLRVGVGQQFTHFGTLQDNGREVDNPDGERLDSSITQIVTGYNFHPRLGVQLNVPIITRHFRRATAAGIDTGDETGFGDLSLIAHVVPLTTVNEHSVVRVGLFGGLELPSGNSDRLREELGEEGGGHDHGAFPSPFPRGQQAVVAVSPDVRASHQTGPGGVPSGIHGHDLALGSGSVNGIIGGQLFTSWRRLFFSGAAQYLLRTEGSFGYQYANDLLWSAGPGLFMVLHDSLAGRQYTVAGQVVLSGEAKGKDTLNGAKVDDTAMTSLYSGPGLAFTWGTSLAADLALDLPLMQNGSALQIVPDYRLRGGITWRF